MGRYDKIRVYNGSSWVQPGNMYVYNGSSWVHYGSNTSYNTQNAYMYNGSSWIRCTRNRQDYTNYNAATNKFVNYTGSSTALSITSGTLTVAARRHHASWAAYLFGMMTSRVEDWWAATNSNTDGAEDWHQWTWSTAHWIERLRYRACNSSNWNGVPIRALVSFRNANGTWTGESTYTVANAHTGSNTWGNYFNFNQKTAAGFTGLKMRYYNNNTYKSGSLSMRIGQYDLLTGTISSGTNWA